jgi:hypothetical protein
MLLSGVYFQRELNGIWSTGDYTIIFTPLIDSNVELEIGNRIDTCNFLKELPRRKVLYLEAKIIIIRTVKKFIYIYIYI